MVNSTTLMSRRHRFTRSSKSLDQSEKRVTRSHQLCIHLVTTQNLYLEFMNAAAAIKHQVQMLKSTHKVAGQAAGQARSEESTFAPGWTEHKAPSGHSYYYNAETKQSTYTRPTVSPPESFFISHTATAPPLAHGQSPGAHGPWPSHGSDLGGSFRGGLSYQDRSRRPKQPDWPKKRKPIPGCDPWVLVTTKLGRRFVYNPDKNESFWKFPQDVLLATFEMDRKEQEEKLAANQPPDRELPGEVATAEPRPGIPPAQKKGDRDQHQADDSDSYEEVEVTDDEDAGTENFDADGNPSKRQRTDLTNHSEPNGPVEFDEEDIAYQLAQMGQDYGLDPGEYDNGDGNEYDPGLPLSLEDSQALFHDLLTDHAINPYTTWEKIIEEDRIIDDERYVALPNMRARKEAFTAWSTDRIQELRENRAKEEKKDPRIPYLRFLHDHATPKLYWPEFKRKYRKEDVMKDAHLSDKEREKLYRDHISHLKLPESQRKSDLKDVLKSIPLHDLHHNSTLQTLPPRLVTDLRFISLPPRTRDSLIEAYISTLPTPPSDTIALDTEAKAEADSKAAERKKREKALRDREKLVQEEKQKVMGAMRQGREIMRLEEREVEEALRESGGRREWMRAYMDEGEGET